MANKHHRPLTFDDLLSIYPLPPHLVGQEAELRSNPYVQHVIEVTNACLEHGMDRAGIENAVSIALRFYAADQHRCVCCFKWDADAKPCGMILDNIFSMLAFCRRCEKLIDQGRVTAKMQRNLKSYIEEVA